MVLLAVLLALVAPAPAAAREGDGRTWRWPVRGDVLTPFHTVANPFAAGQHRGIDIAAEAGERVLSACPGRVSFAGRLPGRGHGVSVLCGPLVATYLELGEVAVARGAAVRAGTPIGRVAASHLQLGARRAGRAHGYVDPLTLLRPRAGPPPLGAAPRARRSDRRRPRAGPPPRPAPVTRRVRDPAPNGSPLAAWVGLALLAGGLPVGALARRRGRRSTALDLRTADEGG